MRGGHAVRAVAMLLVIAGITGSVAAVAFAPGAFAQVPGPVQDSINRTQEQAGEVQDADQYEGIYISASPDQTFADIPERGVHSFPVKIRDMSISGSEFAAGAVQVVCETSVSNETPFEQGWAVTAAFVPPVHRYQTVETSVDIVAGPRAAPEVVKIDVLCSTINPFQRVVGNFTLVGRVEPYTYVQLQNVGVLPTLGPDQQFRHQVLLVNNGNQVTTFVGRVTAPEGWTVTLPDSVILRPGESKLVNITGVTPRDKMLYLSQSSILTVSFHPEGEENRGRAIPFVAQVNGVYIHPAIVPITLLAIVILGSLIFLGVLARRAVDEQILGKPVPPWRMPVEREHLQKLQESDPDEYYVLRYYLMVEEHRSALLWFHAYKRATKKDRKRERVWYKVKGKQERKIRACEKEHLKVGKKWDRKVRKVEKKRDRKVRKLERKLRRRHRKQSRVVRRKHKKRVRRIEKKHRKRVKKVEKKHRRVVAKETKKVDRQNRKRAKRGEELLPPPDIAAPELAEPEIPEQPVVDEVPLEESRYGKRAERIRARTEMRLERLQAKRQAAVEKDREATDLQIERLRAKIPEEPETHLYDQAEYVSEDEVVVEDDRAFLSRLLHIPTLEERERERRRRAVLRADLQRAKANGDVEEFERLATEDRASLGTRIEARRLARAAGAAGGRPPSEATPGAPLEETDLSAPERPEEKAAPKDGILARFRKIGPTGRRSAKREDDEADASEGPDAQTVAEASKEE